MVKLTYTYEIVTPESAEDGCVAEHGWWLPGDWRNPLEDGDGRHEDTLRDARNGDFDRTLRASEASREVRSLLGSFECELNGNKLRASEVDGDTDYSDGSVTTRTAHIEGSPRLLRAMLRALKGR